MALRMPSPTKHTKTGVYYLIVRSPSDLVRSGARPVTLLHISVMGIH